MQDMQRKTLWIAIELYQGEREEIYFKVLQQSDIFPETETYPTSSGFLLHTRSLSYHGSLKLVSFVVWRFFGFDPFNSTNYVPMW